MFSYLFRKIGTGILCKVPPNETICMKREPVVWEDKKNDLKCRLLNFFPACFVVKEIRYLDISLGID